MVLEVTERSDAFISEVETESSPSWFGGLLNWCPTSMALLQQAEKKILSYIKSPFQAKFIKIGTGKEAKENHIRTLILNEKSQKTPIVLIHGFASGVALWCLNLDTFASSRPVYAFDLLGFGRSSRPKFSSNALEAESQLVTSIEEWRAKVGLEKFVLLGHSMGGFLASSYALQYPDRVAHLILADPWGFPERPADGNPTRPNIPVWVKGIAYLLQPFNPLWILRAVGPLGPRLVQRARPDIIRKFSDVIDDAENVIPSYIYHCNAQNPTGEAAFHAMMASFGWAKYPMIYRICALKPEVPITLIYGARSWVDRHPGQQLQTMRSNSYVDVQVIHGAGHHVYADRYEVFNSLVVNVCETVDGKVAAKEIDDVDLISDKAEEKLHDEQADLSNTVIGTFQATEITSSP